MDIKFWSEHQRLRVVLITLFFVVGLAAILFGTSQRGQMSGVVIMLVGLALLLAALWLYNKPFTDPPKTKR